MLRDMLSLAESAGIPKREVLREFGHKTLLMAMFVSGAYQRYVFQGGTCIRMFYGSPRFSYDLDFTILDPIRISADFSKILRLFKEWLNGVGAKTTYRRESLQKFIITLSFEGVEAEIKVELLSRQDRGSLRFERRRMEVDFPFKTLAYVQVKAGEQILADKIASLAGSFAKERPRWRDVFDIYWLSIKGLKLDGNYLQEIFGYWHESLEALRSAILELESGIPRGMKEELEVLLPKPLLNDELLEECRREALKVLKNAEEVLK